MLACAALGEVVNDDAAFLELAGAVAPQIGPVRLASTGVEHCDRCLVGMQHAVAEHLRLECVHQWLQLHAASANPGRQRRARQLNAGARVDAFLAIQRLVIGVLGHQHLRQQTSGGEPLSMT